MAYATYFIWCYAVLAYLFLLSTLDTPMTRWLDRTWVRLLLTGTFVGLSIGIATMDLLAATIGPLLFVDLFDWTWAAILFYGIVAATSAWRRSLPGLVRRKNGFYALAFIVHDVIVALFLAFAGLFLRFMAQMSVSGGYLLAMPGVAGFALQALLVYGILSTQLFDIDIKIRWGVSKGLLTAVFFAGVFAVSELLAGILSARMGLVAGVLVTAVLLVAFSPIRRLADLVAGRLVPSAQDTPEYRQVRKELVYRAQLEELMADNLVSVKERRALLRLQETLGIDGNVALEREVLDELSQTAASRRPASLA